MIELKQDYRPALHSHWHWHLFELQLSHCRHKTKAYSIVIVSLLLKDDTIFRDFFIVSSELNWALLKLFSFVEAYEKTRYHNSDLAWKQRGNAVTA